MQCTIVLCGFFKNGKLSLWEKSVTLTNYGWASPGLHIGMQNRKI